MFAYVVTKPWAKLGSFHAGIILAIVYLEVLAYRQETEERKPKDFPVIHFLHKRQSMGILLWVVGVTLVITCL